MNYIANMHSVLIHTFRTVTSSLKKTMGVDSVSLLLSELEGTSIEGTVASPALSPNWKNSNIDGNKIYM